MKKFLLLLHEDIELSKKLSPREMEELVQEHIKWAAKLEESGHLISGEGLEPSSIILKGKDRTIQDGPYLETKEIIGGFYLLEAESVEKVIEIAKECPNNTWGGTTEIRPIAEYDK